MMGGSLAKDPPEVSEKDSEKIVESMQTDKENKKEPGDIPTPS